jgi:hypothetical protein
MATLDDIKRDATPGPYYAPESSHPYITEVWTDESRHGQGPGMGSIKIAQCAGMNHGANARLIALAPHIFDLADALKSAIRTVESYALQPAGVPFEPQQWQAMVASMDQARTALAKLEEQTSGR